jgi:hypothetical protein
MAAGHRPGQDRTVSERSSGLDALLDLFVYAPVGLALLASEELPKLAARGRAQLGGQLSMAKVVGQFAVAQGRRHLDSRQPPGATTRRAYSYVPSPNVTPASPDAPATPAATATAPCATATPPSTTAPPGETPPSPAAGDQLEIVGAEDVGSARPMAPEGGNDRPSPAKAAAEGPSDQPDEADEPVQDAFGLAIPGYDSLAASQVVPRLAGLSAEELAAVGAYESAHRARRTILNRVRQLQER